MGLLLLLAKSLQSYMTLFDPIDGSPPGSSVHRILQARTLEWVAISFSQSCGECTIYSHSTDKVTEATWLHNSPVPGGIQAEHEGSLCDDIVKGLELPIDV